MSALTVAGLTGASNEAGFTLGLASGLLVAGLALGMRVAWETWRSNREQRERDLAALRALWEELNTNAAVLDANLRLLRRSQGELDRESIVVRQAMPLHTDTSRVIRPAPPKAIVERRPILNGVWNLASAAEYLNAVIRTPASDN